MKNAKQKSRLASILIIASMLAQSVAGITAFAEPVEEAAMAEAEPMQISETSENLEVLSAETESDDSVVEVAEEEVKLKGEKGNTVTQMLIDPQTTDLTNGGLGLVAMLYFSEDGKKVDVRYYSTVREKFYLEDNQFSFNLDV